VPEPEYSRSSRATHLEERVAVEPSVPAASSGRTSLIWSYILAAISVLFVPILFGPAAIFLGYRAGKAGNPNGKQAMTIAVIAMLVGFVLAALVLTA
jgi:putative exporter of polyketide antibiotics